MTKKQEDNALTLNFAEANIQDKDNIRLFRDYADRRFLVGYIPEKSKDWVRRNRLYNVRVAAENCKGGVDETNPLSYAADYIILYKNRQRNQYRICRVDYYEHVSQEEMADMLSQTKSVKLSA